MGSLRGAGTTWRWRRNRGLSAATIPMILGLVGPLSGCASDQQSSLVDNCLHDVACLEFAASTSSLWLPLIDGSDGGGAVREVSTGSGNPESFTLPASPPSVRHSREEAGMH